jgi:hypothetical protein
MSTGENINANGAGLTQGMVRMGFQKFPQSETVWVNPKQWPLIAPIEIAEGYPFKAVESEAVPSGQVWYVGSNGEILGRIVNLGT